MTEHTTQDERWYRVENRVSGFDAGFFAATSPEEAIAAMMEEAGYDARDASPDWIATEVALVQMIQPRPYEEQGLVEYAGFPEGLDEWIWSTRDDYHASLVSTRVQGWSDATAIVRLERDGDPALYYLVHPTALRAMLDADMIDAAFIAAAAAKPHDPCAIGHFLDPLDCKQYPDGCKACYEGE